MIEKPKLYHCADTRSFRALWALEEIGIEYDLEMLAFPPVFNEPGYMEENPTGTVPLLVDGDVRMKESVAICDYLARKHGRDDLAVAFDDPLYPDYLDTLFFGEASLSWPQGVRLMYSKFLPEERRQPAVAEDMRKRTIRLLIDAEARLGDAEYFVGGHFTMADISMAYALGMTRSTGLFDGLADSLKSYLARVEQRDAFHRSKQRQQ